MTEQQILVKEYNNHFPSSQITLVDKKYDVFIAGSSLQNSKGDIILSADDFPEKGDKRIRGKYIGLATSRKLRSIIRQDIKDKKLIKSIRKIVVNYGSSLQAVKYTPPNGGQLRFQVEKFDGTLSNWWPRNRGMEYRWGRKNILYTQSLIYFVMQNMFPDVEWHYEYKHPICGQLDIYSPGLGEKPFAIEYQGYSSHRECAKTISRDIYKLANFEGDLLQISPIESPTLTRIRDLLVVEFEKNNPHNIIGEMRPVNIDQLTKKLPEYHRTMILAYTAKLLQALKQANPNHKLTTPHLQVSPGEAIDYICGYCTGNARVKMAKTFINMPSAGCINCMGDRIKKKASKERIQKFKTDLGANIWANIHPDIAKQLSLLNGSTNIGIICPFCNTRGDSGKTVTAMIRMLQKNKGYLCGNCLNRGKKINDDPRAIGSIRHWYDNAKKIIEATGWGDMACFADYLSPSPDGTLLFTLHCHNGHKQQRTLVQWNSHLQGEKRSKNGNYCDECTGINGKQKTTHEIIALLAATYPDVKLIQNDTIANKQVYNCGTITNVGVFSILHPNFSYNVKNLLQIQKRKTQVCCICDDLNKKKGRSRIEKTMEIAQARWQLRAAIVATTLGAKDISTAIVFDPKNNLVSTDKIPSTTTTKLCFKCHNPSHQPEIKDFSNRFNDAKLGYCKQCLHGLTSRTNAELLEIAKLTIANQ